MADIKDKSKKKIVGARTKFDKKVTESSKRYLLRQAKDLYTRKAQEDGYRSRAAYKLIEMNEKYKLLKPGMSVVDLGAAPGGWSQVLARELGGQATLVAIDKLPMDGIAGVDIMEGDFTEDSVYEALLEKCPKKVDLVVSDMAPETTGHSGADHMKSMMLCELGADFAFQTLKVGGHFACKLFMGGEENEFRAMLRQRFKKANFFKPDSSRKESREIFLVAEHFLG